MSERKFKCTHCNLKFEATGKRTEWTDVVYGPCFKYTAFCPQCGQESAEYHPAPVSHHTEVPSHTDGCHGNCHCCGT